MASRLRLALVALCLGLCACSASGPTLRRAPEGAALLFDVDFSAPEQTVGAEVKFAKRGTVQPYPSKIPSAGSFGHPTVIAKFCGLEQQPVQLAVASGIQGMEGLDFQLDGRYGRYHVELDMCVERLDPPPLPAQAVQVVVFLDIPEAHAFGFVSGGKLVIIDPTLHPETITNPKPVGKFEPGKPVHVTFDVDFKKQTWRIAVDGKAVYDAAVQASIPLAVRVMVRGNPATTAAFDNLRIWGEHDLTAERMMLEPPTAGPETEPPEK